MAGQQGAKQASGRDNVVLVSLLLEVFEGVQRLRALLYLIENDESLPRQNLFSGDHGQQFNNPLGILVCFKNGFQLVFLIEVEVDIILVTALPKLLHKPGLAHLTGAANNQRLPFRVVLPFYELRKRASLHASHHLLL